MQTFVLLIRGINVGGKNKVPMADLRALLAEDCGCEDVRTYINSGNAIVRSDLAADDLERSIERALPKRCSLDVELVKIHALTKRQFRSVIAKKPNGFGEQPDTYHSDAIFLMGDLTPKQAMPVFTPREGVDEVWPGTGVVYSQRVSAQRTKSRLGKIVGTEPYQSMTIRSWKTVEKLGAMLDEV